MSGSEHAVTQLNVIVVGGGIAGLTAAITLRRIGHTVHIYERSSFHSEVGAAINVCPNASRALLPFGMDPIKSRFVNPTTAFLGDGKTTAISCKMDYQYLKAKFGAPLFYAHRVDLHNELKRLAVEAGAIIHLKKAVQNYGVEEGSVSFDDGTKVFGDIVVAADSVHSIAAKAIDIERPVTSTGKFIYRFLLNTKDLLANSETHDLFDGAEGKMQVFNVDERKVVIYPCRNNEVQNCACIFKDDDLTLDESWENLVDHRAVLKRFADFHPSIVAIIRMAEDARQWPLLYRPPVKTWHKQKLLLIGDAAHPMLPHMAQGGAQAIEDGVALGIMLSNLPNSNTETLEHRVQLFEKLRVVRSSVAQIFSNVDQRDAEQMHLLASEFMPADKLPRSPQDLEKHNYGYDIVKESEKLMASDCPGWKLPAAFSSN